MFLFICLERINEVMNTNKLTEDSCFITMLANPMFPKKNMFCVL